MASNDPTLVDRAKRLFTFLARAQELKTKPVRGVESYARSEGSVEWLGKLPEHPAVRMAFRDEVPEDRFLVSIDRIPPIEPPEPPSSLGPWLIGNHEGPSEQLKLRDQLEIRREWNEERRESVPVYESLTDRRDVQAAFDRWLTNWQPWAERERRDRPVRDLYHRLFQTYVTAEGRTEDMELVLGVNLLAWQPTQHDPVRRHVHVASLAASVDDRTGRLEFQVHDSAQGLRAELDMLDPNVIPLRQTVQQVEDAALDFGGHPLDEEAVRPLAQAFINHLDADGQYLADMSVPDVEQYARLAFAPAIILRPRPQTGLVRIFETIVEQIDEAEAVPDGLLPLIDPNHTPAVNDAPSPGALLEIDDEIYSPLPLNPVQHEIINRVGRHAQTLVQGPPGTGKTHTAAALLSHLLAQGKRVLVTAHTDRALEEVREKLPAQIKPLAVSVIGTSRADMADLKLAVDTIARAASDHDPGHGEAQVSRAQERAHELQEERRALRGQLLTARQAEVEGREYLGYSGTLAEIAQRYQSEQDEFGWILEFQIPATATTSPLTDEEATELLGLLRDSTLAVDAEESQHRLVPLDTVADPDEYAGLLARLDGAYDEHHAHSESRLHQAAAAIRELPPETRQQLSEHFAGLLRTIDEVGQLQTPWIEDALGSVRSGATTVWEGRRHNVSVLIEQARGILYYLPLGTKVTVSGDPGATYALAQSLKAHAERNPIKTNVDGTPKMGMFTPAAVKQSQALFAGVRVNGLPPTTPDALGRVMAFLDASRLIDEMDRQWPATIVIPPEDTPQERIGWHEQQVQQLSRVFELGDRLARTDAWLRDIRVPRPNWTSEADIRSYTHVVEAEGAADRFNAAKVPLKKLDGVIDDVLRWGDAAQASTQLRWATDETDPTAYKAAFERLRRLHEVRSCLERRDELARRLNKSAPALAKSLTESADDRHWTRELGALSAAWTWTAVGHWILRQDEDDANTLQAKVGALDVQLRHCSETIAQGRAWNHAVGPTRLNGAARADLTQYSQLVRRLGKGTGKYAAKQRAEIRSAMDRCRPAVPVWIMPIYRIAEQLAVTENMFDVVLIDEASQAGLEATFLQYLAPTIVVIGDDKQVSPTAVGIDQSQLRQLADQYLFDDRYKASWLDPKRSFFDEAKMRFGGQLTLTEHRRCVPEIIGFSNRVAYEPDGIRLQPVRQYGADRLEPIKMVHTADGLAEGSGQKVNVAEAEATVAQILKCLDDPTYDGRTMGVISLVGRAQAQHIERMLLERMPAEEWESRALRCGDAADFQGSERDVIFLSMVTSVDPDGGRIYALTQEMYMQRFNVAVSRAKDQVWLMHSVTLNDLPRKDDLRHQLLDYCLTHVQRSAGALAPSAPVSETERVALFDSLFEQRVHNMIVGRGYLVEAQVEFSGYWIDLVVIGARGKIAVECDGDHWHGPDAYERDLARQRDLERCGWRFFRIRESQFYVDRARAMQGLWVLLEEMGIEPFSLWGIPVAEPDGEGEPVQIDLKVIEPSAHGAAFAQEDASTLTTPTQSAPAARVEEDVETETDDDWDESELAADREIDEKGAREASVASTSVAIPLADNERLAPYVAFAGSLPAVQSSSTNDIVEGLLSITRVEGPLVGQRLLSAYVTASGGQRLGRDVKTRLNDALARAVRSGHLVSSRPLGETRLIERTYRLPTQREVNLRDLGPRSLGLVPPQELAGLIDLVGSGSPMHEEVLFRRVLGALGRQVLTQVARERLVRVLPLAGQQSIPFAAPSSQSKSPERAAPIEREAAADARGADFQPSMPQPNTGAIASPRLGGQTPHSGQSHSLASANLRTELHRAMLDLYARTKRETGYDAHQFAQMLGSVGGLETARHLLHAPGPSSGFVHLWELRRLDLTAEALVLDPRFRTLFTDAEVQTATSRVMESDGLDG